MKMKQCLVATLLTAVLLSSPAAFATGPEEDMAKLMFSEAYDVTDTIELSRIAWSILNRVDAGEASSIAESVRQYNFKEGAPLVGKFLRISNNVLRNWEHEKTGKGGVKRTLPKRYIAFCRDGHRTEFYTSTWR